MNDILQGLARAAKLGEVITGKCPGRTAAGQITICDLTGTGAQDTAIATHAAALARAAGSGVKITA